MYYILAVFKSRSETLFFANLLKSNGLIVNVVNTPKQAGQTCGISVKFMPNNLAEVRRLLASRSFQSFVGFYTVMLRNGQNDVSRI